MKIKAKSIRFRFFALILVSALVLLISITGISAFGVGCAYFEGNPLKLSPGENANVIVNLQNDKDTQLKSSIMNGADIAKFTDASDIYDLPAQSWINANLKVSIPANACPGQEYTVTMRFEEIAQNTDGTIGISIAIEKSFKVIVIDKNPSQNPNLNPNLNPNCINYYANDCLTKSKSAKALQACLAKITGDITKIDITNSDIKAKINQTMKKYESLFQLPFKFPKR